MAIQAVMPIYYILVPKEYGLSKHQHLCYFFGLRGAQIVIRGVLDDHYDVAESRYTARITINNIPVFNGRVPFVHGTPAGAIFNNWRELVLNIPNLRRNNRVEIANTSTANPDDWIAFDWMELRIATLG